MASTTSPAPSTPKTRPYDSVQTPHTDPNNPNCGMTKSPRRNSSASPTTNATEATVAEGQTKSDNVRVAVRVRPLNGREKAAAAESKYSWIINSQAITQAANGKPISNNFYSFDNVYQPPANNEKIFDNVAKQVVSSAVDGINGVIFAYGQTAAGKTHTMLGNLEDLGVTPRSIQYVFELISKLSSRQFLLRASYIEIYNEVIRDLLFPANDNLKIHEDAINKRVFVDAKEEVVTSVEHVMQIIAQGENVRAVGETNMNDRSSRSHTIFSLKIESREMTQQDARERRRTQAIQEGIPINEEEEENENDSENNSDGVAIRSSSLSLVDLAGSERASFTKAQGMRLVEGGHINKSLLTLGNVINKLSSGEARSLAHIPYRDSKLTRLLQPALGGNARTAIICAVTPAILHMEETLSTLKFASRAKKVTNSAKTNEFLDDRAKLRRAEKLINDLKKQLQKGQQLSFNNSSPRQTSNNSKRLSFSSNQSASTSPTTRKKLSLSNEKKNEKKFDRLIDAISKSNSQHLTPHAASSSPPPKRRRILPHTIIQALHLICGPAAHQSRNMSTGQHQQRPQRRDSKNSKSNGGYDDGYDEPTLAIDGPSSYHSSSVEKEMAFLRKQAFEAVKNERQKEAMIRYEREAMQRESMQLLQVAEEANRMRDLAERECSDMHSQLGKVIGRSLVDETLSNVFSLSKIRGQLHTATEKVQVLPTIQKENEDLKSDLQSTRKEVIDLTRREKRGIGPVLKDCKLAQSKLAEVENKLRCVKQSNSQTSIDKAKLEREIKSKERLIKVLTAKVEEIQRKDESKFQSKLKKGIDKVEKKASLEASKLIHKIDTLTTELESLNAERKKLEEELKELSEQLEEERNKNVDVNGKLQTSVSERDQLQEQLDVMAIESKNLSKQLEEWKDKTTKTEKVVDAVSMELGDTKGELERAYTEKSNLIIEVQEFTAKFLKLEHSMMEIQTQKEELQLNLDEEKANLLSTFAEASKWEARSENELSKREQEERKRMQVEEVNQDLEKQISKLNLQIADLQSNLTDIKEKAEQSQLAYDKTIQKYKEKCSTNEIKLNELLEVISNLEANKESMMHNHQEECKNIKYQVTEEMETEIKRISKEIQAQKQQQLEIERKSSLQREEKECKRANALDEELRMTRDEVTRIQVLSEQELQGYKTREDEYAASIERKDEKLNNLREQIAEISIQLEHQKSELQQKEAAIISVTSERQELAAQLDEAHRQVRKEQLKQVQGKENMDMNTGNIIAQVENLKRQLSLAESRKQAVQIEYRGTLETEYKMRKEATNAYKSLKERDEHIARLEKQISDIKNGNGVIPSLKQRILRRDAEIHSLTKDVDRFRKVVQVQNPHLLEIDLRKLSEVESENTMLRKEKEAIASATERLHREVAKLKKDGLVLRSWIKSRDIQTLERSTDKTRRMLDELDADMKSESVNNTPASDAVLDSTVESVDYRQRY